MPNSNGSQQQHNQDLPIFAKVSTSIYNKQKVFRISELRQYYEPDKYRSIDNTILLEHFETKHDAMKACERKGYRAILSWASAKDAAKIYLRLKNYS